MLFFLCNVFLQSIVLSRIIPDNEPANITAIGIRTIVDTLERSQAHHTLALAADCVARLAHTRAGKEQRICYRCTHFQVEK